MALQVDEQWLKDYCARTGKDPPTAGSTAQPKQTRTKYGNQKTESHGRRFDSKHEAEVYEQLRLRCLGGEFIALACQVPFYLTGGIKYVADFVTLDKQMRVTVHDAKSEATRKDKVYRLKRRLMAECLQITIEEV